MVTLEEIESKYLMDLGGLVQKGQYGVAKEIR
jgi:hypothetical protein